MHLAPVLSDFQFNVSSTRKMTKNDGEMGLFLASLAKGRGTAAAVGGFEI